MEKKEIKRVFRDYLPTTRAYKLAVKKAERIEADAQSLKAVVITGMPHGSGVSDPVSNAVCKLLDAAERVKAAAEKYADQIRQYEYLVSLVSDPQAIEIIRLHWEQDVDFDYIPAKIHASRRTMFYHYGKAIEEIYTKTQTLH